MSFLDQPLLCNKLLQNIIASDNEDFYVGILGSGI